MVSYQYVSEPLLGCPLLDALGLDPPKILAAAAEKYAGNKDYYNLDMTIVDNSTGNVSQFLEGVYHKDESDVVDDEEYTTPD